MHWVKNLIQGELSQFWIFPPPSARQSLNLVELLGESQWVGGGDGEVGLVLDCHLCSQTSWKTTSVFSPVSLSCRWQSCCWTNFCKGLSRAASPQGGQTSWNGGKTQRLSYLTLAFSPCLAISALLLLYHVCHGRFWKTSLGHLTLSQVLFGTKAQVLSAFKTLYKSGGLGTYSEERDAHRPPS